MGYVYNNPVNYTDPSGHIPIWDILDVASFGLSLNDFIRDPSLANFGWLALDAVDLLPIIPSIGALRHAGKLGRADAVADVARYADCPITSLTTDASKTVIHEARYLPFGGQRWSSGAGVTDFGFTGQRRDGFGLMDYNARYYSSRLGRFVSADTVVPDESNPQSWNRYSYVYNSPLKYIDPSGHIGVRTRHRNEFETWWGGGGGRGGRGGRGSWGRGIGIGISIGGGVAGGVVASNAVKDNAQTNSTTQTATQPQPTPTNEPKIGPGPTPTPEGEIFYRFIPTSEVPYVESGQYDKLWKPNNRGQNFMSQDYDYVNNLAARTANREGESMTVLEIHTNPGTFDYMTNPNNARLHSGISNDEDNMEWLQRQVNYPVSSYQTFVSGDGINYLQLKQETNQTLTIGFFRAQMHKQYFEEQINSVERRSEH